MLKDDESVRVAGNFKRLREAKGWTQYETAQRPAKPVSYKYIGHIEQCQTGLGKRGRRAWAKIFGVDVSEFLKPLSENEFDHEISTLIDEAKKYGPEQIKRLRQLMPLLLGKGGSYVHEEVKKNHNKNHEEQKKSGP